MKLKTEISPGYEEEVIIRAPAETDGVRRLRSLIEEAILYGEGIGLYDSGKEYYLPYREILFFEASGGKVYAHTGNGVYISQLNLTELCGVLPAYFARASKSCLINAMRVYSLNRSPTGVGEAEFTRSPKKAYVSRMYYKEVKETVEEMRTKK